MGPEVIIQSKAIKQISVNDIVSLFFRQITGKVPEIYAQLSGIVS